MPSGTFHYYLFTKLNTDATSRTQQLHCYVVKFRFTSLYGKMAATHVVSSDNMSRLHTCNVLQTHPAAHLSVKLFCKQPKIAKIFLKAQYSRLIELYYSPLGEDHDKNVKK